MINRILFENICKYALVSILDKSQYINESISKHDKDLMIKWIKDMTYTEVISSIWNDGVMFNEGEVRSFDSSLKRSAKYHLAYIAGASVGVGAVVSRKVKLKQLGYFPYLGAAVLAIYRRLNDPCYRKCFSKFGLGDIRTVCKKKCKKRAISNILKTIKSHKTSCSKTANPGKCLKGLSRQQKSWNKKLKIANKKLKIAIKKVKNS